MNIEELRDYCLKKKWVQETFPFGPETLVFKVKEKAFLLTGLDSEDFSFNVKCDPEKAIALRESYPSVQPGYHMNKKHWNTIYVDGSVDDSMLTSWIDHSYDLVLGGIPKKKTKTAGKKTPVKNRLLKKAPPEKKHARDKTE